MQTVSLEVHRAVLVERDEALAEVDRLRGQLLAKLPFPFSWGFSPIQARMMTVLLAREFASNDLLMGIIEELSVRNVNPITAVRTQIWALRDKLRPMGVCIRNKYQIGYFIPPESKDLLRRAMAQP